MMIEQNLECILRVCQETMRSKSYTASSDAGPSSTAVIPSTVTVAGSLATYLESPLLYSFPEQRASIWSVKHHFDTQHENTAMARGVPEGELTDFIEVVGVFLTEESGVENEGPLDDDVGEAGERPPAHEQTVRLG